MPTNDSSQADDQARKIVAEARREGERREGEYRARALKMFPHVCGRCGREFSGKKLRELTVHHKDHDHDHNPPDGSNWELLCFYCHDNMHQRTLSGEYGEAALPDSRSGSPSISQPFAALADLLKEKK